MDRRIALIVLAELCGTSLWFSGNNAINELVARWGLSEAAKAWFLMAAQLGFIAGTLALAASGLADAFRSHHVFAVSAAAGPGPPRFRLGPGRGGGAPTPGSSC
jgi:hypothetical protein